MFNKVLHLKEHAVEQVYSLLSDNGFRGKFLFVTDPYLKELYGEAVQRQLEELGVVKTELVENNTIRYAMSLAERVIATDVDYIAALGGGKVLDVCKYAAYVAKRPFISIPTTLAHDGIASPIAVLKREDQKPKSLGCAMPSVVIIDTSIVRSGPQELIRAGIGDTISNHMALLDWDFAVSRGKDSMNSFARLMSRSSLDALLRTTYEADSPEFLGVLANSLILSGIAMDFAGSSRPVSGSEHLFSHALDYFCKKQKLHGLQTALGTVAVLKLLEGQIGKFPEICAADLAYDEMLQYLKRFHVDIHPVRMGIDRDEFILCMQKATTMRTNRYTYLHELDLSSEIVGGVYDSLVEELA